ncbi:MAG TPA: endonuclease III [Gammaproteobacteria bacterium]|jgi:endonuclease-3|nr:endonuclease III [Gammaproteobacteria bacterium]
MTPQTIRKIFQRFQKADPHPTTELVYHSDFELLVAVILSAQATDKSVNKATKNLFPIANTPEKMLKLGEQGLTEKIKSIGLYKSKAKNIIATCQLLVTKFDSRIPETRELLETLPGVGRKTANVMLNTCFNQPTIAVDTHLFRLANRIGLAPGSTPLAVEKKLLACIPAAFMQHAHHWLILHGRYVCTARKPHCPTCIIKDLCEYPHKTVGT